MIILRNKQRKIYVMTKEFKKQALNMLAALEYKDFDLGIWLTTNATIRNYNKKYRHKDAATDILSFPYHTNLQAEQRIVVDTQEDKNLGDIIISLEFVQKQAPMWRHTFKQHLTMLLAHGIAHLLGYDHQTDKDYAVMHKLEKKLLKSVN